MIKIELTADELSNVTSALEAHIEYLSSRYGEQDYEGDTAEVLESTKSALSKVNQAGFEHLTKPSSGQPFGAA